MEKAIEIKRRAQRCILSGDLDGALSAYEKLIATGDSDPYHSVLLADLLFKKGDHEGAARRYQDAVAGYEQMALYKNAIAVCKKMSRLSLAAELVLQRLASLHALDGLATESSLYYMQHAEVLLQRKDLAHGIESLRRAFQVCPDNVKALERLGEAQNELGSREEAASTFLESASHYERLGQLVDAKRCQSRARELMPGITAANGAPSDASPPLVAGASLEAPVPAEALVSDPPATGSSSPATVPTPSSDEETSDPGDAMVIERNTYPSATNVVATPAPAIPTPHARTPAMPPVTAIPAVASAPSDSIDASGPLEATPVEPNGDASSSPARPGIHFDWQAAEAAGAAGIPGLPEVSVLLDEAQILFQSGEREAASASLIRAAQAYDRLGRFDSAAAIYRSLSKVSEAPLQLMLLWLKNCQRRDDRQEAARVACDLGDRAIMDGDPAGAREWFERARAYDRDNPTASRRLERLLNPTPSAVATEVEAVPVSDSAVPVSDSAVPVSDLAVPAPDSATVPAPAELPAPTSAPAAAKPAPPPVVQAKPAPIPSGPRVIPKSSTAPPADPGLIEVSVEEAEPLVFDLGNLISEFQRGLEAQLASDPQGHYDLAMSYCEMGLYDEAIASFELAAYAPSLRVRSTEMIGRCMLDRGDFDAAAEYFQSAIDMPELDLATQPDLRFQLGLALEVGGRLDEALECFERIYADQQNYPDVAQKIRALRKALEKD